MITGIGLGMLVVGAALFVVVLYHDDIPFQAILLPFVLVLLGVGCIVYDNDLANRRLMDACRQDHKEYECVSMLERGH